MIVRPAEMSDKRDILALAKEQAARFPKLRMDIEKINDGIVNALLDSKSFVHVVEDEGKVTGVIIALTTPNLWAQRACSTVVLWVSKTPGGGVALLRAFRGWIKARRAVKLGGISPNLDLDWRILKIMERAGFERHGGSYLLYN
jgi:hypothetical protein